MSGGLPPIGGSGSVLPNDGSSDPVVNTWVHNIKNNNLTAQEVDAFSRLPEQKQRRIAIVLLHNLNDISALLDAGSPVLANIMSMMAPFNTRIKNLLEEKDLS
jgi:hypothetical protein